MLEGVGVEVPNDAQTQLYAYDRNSVQQLTNLAPHSANYIMDFGVSEKGIVWVANDDAENRDKRNLEIFVATLIQQDSIDNNPETPNPIPIPTPIPTLTVVATDANLRLLASLRGDPATSASLTRAVELDR